MKTRPFWMLSVGLAAVAALSTGPNSLARAGQTPSGQTPSSPSQAKSADQPPDVKGVLGPNADSIQPYKSAGRDPFRRVIVKAGSGARAAPRQLGFPSLDTRRAQFRQKLVQAHTSGAAEPNPLGQYLVSELNVIGTFTDENGPGVFLRAQPSGTTFFVRRGAKCFNGEVARIESDPADLSNARVVFKETSYTEQDGKQTPSERLVTKSVGSH
jgi:hypothetical protein